MIENNLTRALREFLEDKLKNLRFATRGGELRPPLIVNGYLPPKKSKMDDDFPFVIVRLEKGSVEQCVRQMTVSIIIGCYAEEDAGFEHCVNVCTRIINELTTCMNQTLDDRFILSFPVSWQIPAEQPYPQWQLVMTTEWTARTPEIMFEQEGGLYGD